MRSRLKSKIKKLFQNEGRFRNCCIVVGADCNCIGITRTRKFSSSSTDTIITRSKSTICGHATIHQTTKTTNNAKRIVWNGKKTSSVMDNFLDFWFVILFTMLNSWFKANNILNHLWIKLNFQLKKKKEKFIKNRHFFYLCLNFTVDCINHALYFIRIHVTQIPLVIIPCSYIYSIFLTSETLSSIPLKFR